MPAPLKSEYKAYSRHLARSISSHLLVRALRIIAVVEIETAAHPVREAASADHAGLRRRAQRVEQQAGQCKRAEMIGADMQFETIARPAARYHDRRRVVTENVETLMSRIELPAELQERGPTPEVDHPCRVCGGRGSSAG